MKVLVLQSELGVLRGGGETFTRNLFTAFVKRGHHVAAAFVADRRSRYPIPLPSCMVAIPIPGLWSRKLGQAALSSVGRYLSYGTRFRSEWDRVQEAICWRTIRWHNGRFQGRIEQRFANHWSEYDAVYVNGNVELGGKAAVHRPTVLMLPGPVSADRVPTLRAVHAVCSHDDGFARLRDHLGNEALEIPLGINSQLFNCEGGSMRAALDWTPGNLVLGYVGRLTHLKGVDILAEAFRDLSRTTNDFRLLIVGEGEFESKIRFILADQIARRIVHIEPGVSQEQLPGWYRAMDLLVMPSRYETLSNAVLEALACRVPFLASDVGGNRKLAKTGYGWLFESESVSSLTDFVRRIITNRAEIRARGVAGSRYIRENYSWDRSAERLESILISRLGVQP